MSLKQWADNGWLKAHKTSPGEIKALLGIAERDLKDAEADISPDSRFRIAYNAALSLCTILLYAEGFRPAKESLHHYRTLAALPLILGKDREKDAQYLDTCRIKRSKAEYDYAGVATHNEAKELIDFAKDLRDEVAVWLKIRHSQLI